MGPEDSQVMKNHLPVNGDNKIPASHSFICPGQGDTPFRTAHPSLAFLALGLTFKKSLCQDLTGNKVKQRILLSKLLVLICTKALR